MNLIKSDQQLQEDWKKKSEGGSIEHQDSSILFASETTSHELLNEKDDVSHDNLAKMLQGLKTSEDSMMGIKAMSIHECVMVTSSSPKDEGNESFSHCSHSSTHSFQEPAPAPAPSVFSGSTAQSMPVMHTSSLEASLEPTEKQFCLKFAAEHFVFQVYYVYMYVHVNVHVYMIFTQTFVVMTCPSLVMCINNIDLIFLIVISSVMFEL